MKLISTVTICFACILLVTGCSNQQQGNTAAVAPKPNLSTPGFVIDSHIHYRATDEWEKSYLEVFKKWNALGIILVGMNDLEKGIQFAKAHPDRVIPYAAIKIDSPTVLDDIRRVHKMGFKGLGELFALNEWDYNHPKYLPIWALAEELRLPIAPHTGIHASGQMSRMRPGYLASIAAKHPDLIIHAAHFGNPWYNEAGETTRRNKNLYFVGRAIAVRSASGNPGLCIIDCENDGRGFSFHLNEGVTTIVEGLTITNGYADFPAPSYGRGGGIWCDSGSSPTLKNCVITGNTAANTGTGPRGVCDAA